MPKFKVSVSKDQKKYSIILNADSDVSARKKVHDGWYSILAVEEISEEKIEGHKFIFEAIDKEWNVKKWKVVANDPFKVFVKLKEGLWYKVKFLYSQTDEDKSEWIKLDIVKHLEEQYELYNSKKSQKISKKEVKEEKKNLDNFYLKKELDETYRLIDFVLIKLKHILDNANEEEVSKIKKQKIKTLYNSIIKLKSTTNISKLKEIWETALKKVWEIELSIVEKNKSKNSRKYLKETNNLLKKLGSKESFIEKEKDINYIISSFVEWFKEKINSLKNSIIKEKKEKDEVDKESTSYWKTQLLIKKYSDKKKELNKDLLKILIKFYKKEEREKITDIKIKQKVVNQNITILKAKQTGKIISYTKLIKWYNYFIELLLALLKILNTYIIWFIYLFSVLILTFLLLNKFNIINSNINNWWIFIFLYIMFWSLLIFLSRWILSVSINIAIFFFMIILGVVNF